MNTSTHGKGDSESLKNGVSLRSRWKLTGDAAEDCPTLWSNRQPIRGQEDWKLGRQHDQTYTVDPSVSTESVSWPA
jgi:hypothetical protein